MWHLSQHARFNKDWNALLAALHLESYALCQQQMRTLKSYSSARKLSRGCVCCQPEARKKQRSQSECFSFIWNLKKKKKKWPYLYDVWYMSFHPCLRLRTGHHRLRSNRQSQPHWPHRSSDIWPFGKLEHFGPDVSAWFKVPLCAQERK